MKKMFPALFGLVLIYYFGPHRTPVLPDAADLIEAGLPEAGALDFDGTDDGVTVPERSSLAVHYGNFTVECWVKPAALSDDRITFLDKSLDAEGHLHDGFRLYAAPRTGNVGICLIEEKTMRCFEGQSSILDGQYHHVAAVRTCDQVSIIVDGREDSTHRVLKQQVSPGLGVTNLTIGIQADGQYPMKGEMDELRIWNRALSLAELENRLHCPPGEKEPGLVVYFNFDQGVACGDNRGISRLLDQSGNGNHGLLHQFTARGISSNWVAQEVQISPSCVFIQALGAVSGSCLSDFTTGGIGQVSGRAEKNASTGFWILNASITGQTAGETTDHQYAVSRGFCGDGSIITQLLAIEGNGTAGIFIRESPTADGQSIFLETTGKSFSVRHQDACTAQVRAGAELADARGWMRLTRRGDIFSAYHSGDGHHWDLLSSLQIPMTVCAEAGIFTGAAGDGQVTTAVFRKFAWQPLPAEAADTGTKALRWDQYQGPWDAAGYLSASPIAAAEQL